VIPTEVKKIPAEFRAHPSRASEIACNCESLIIGQTLSGTVFASFYAGGGSPFRLKSLPFFGL
jgi:hypothetical protein